MTGLNRALLFTAYVLSSVTGLAILKRYMVRVSPLPPSGPVSRRVIGFLCLGGLLYFVSFGLWLMILRTVPLVRAYPAAVGLTIAGTTLLSLVFLRETLRVDQALGIALILFGTLLTMRAG